MHVDRCDDICGHKCCAKGSTKEVKIQQFMYKDTTNVEHEMCACTVPAICGATGTVTKGIKNNLEAKAGKHSADSVPKTAVFGTAHIMRKVLQCDTGTAHIMGKVLQCDTGTSHVMGKVLQ